MNYFPPLRGWQPIKARQTFECSNCGNTTQVCALDKVILIGLRCEKCHKRMRNVTTPMRYRARRKQLLRLGIDKLPDRKRA